MHTGILIVSKQTLVVIFKKKNSVFWRLISSWRHNWFITVLLNEFILLLFVFPQVPLFTTGHVAVNVIVFLDTKYCNNCLCSLRFCKFLWCSERLSMWMFQQGSRIRVFRSDTDLFWSLRSNFLQNWTFIFIFID